MYYDHITCMYHDHSAGIMSNRPHVRRNRERGVQGAQPARKAGRLGVRGLPNINPRLGEGKMAGGDHKNPTFFPAGMIPSPGMVR